jgi:secondary thiamine-phosphate synthase enzyme
MIANQAQVQQMVQQTIAIRTNGKKLHNITRQVEAVLAQSGIKMGLCNVFLRHTSASLIIQENADPDVLADLETFFTKLISEDASQYRHISEGLAVTYSQHPYQNLRNDPDRKW